jgi:hypothetical protein
MCASPTGQGDDRTDLHGRGTHGVAAGGKRAVTAANPFADEEEEEDDDDDDGDDGDMDAPSSGGGAGTGADDGSGGGASLFRDLAWSVTDPAAMELRLMGEMTALEAVWRCVRLRTMGNARAVALTHACA